MKLSYNKLWHLLLDKKMNKQMLSKAANISASTLTKMAKDESVNSDIFAKICSALDCDISDIMELVPDNEGKTALPAEKE
jgi:DNA-binding Xre family transcriptional regulator